MDKLMTLASENSVVIFSKSSCCMTHVVNSLFQELGVPPVIHKIDLDPECVEMEIALIYLGFSEPLPAVFIGGNLVGSINDVMSLHLRRALVPLLQQFRNTP